MDPKLLAWAGGDITKINVDPAKRARLYAKYGRPQTAVAA
jgi:alkane 1-monooxygenase